MNKVLIVDDERRSRENLSSLIKEYCPTLTIIGEADGVESGFHMIQELQPNAVFLDIAMLDGTGFDLLDRFDHYPFQVIFQTAFDEFAIKAFKYNAIDYLLKPIAIPELVKAANKISVESRAKEFSAQLSALVALSKKKTFDRIVLNSNEGMHFVELKNIIRLQSDANYTTFYLVSGERITVTKTIKTFQKLLPEQHFFRSHQSHILHLKYITKILREDGGYARLTDGTKIPISRSKKEAFIIALQAYAGGH